MADKLIIAAVAFVALTIFSLSGCIEQPPAQDANVQVISFRSAEPQHYTSEKLCSITCEDFNYSNWKLQQDVNSGRLSCLCTKEICRREDTGSVVYNYCSDVDYKFYIPEEDA